MGLREISTKFTYPYLTAFTYGLATITLLSTCAQSLAQHIKGETCKKIRNAVILPSSISVLVLGSPERLGREKRA